MKRLSRGPVDGAVVGPAPWPVPLKDGALSAPGLEMGARAGIVRHSITRKPKANSAPVSGSSKGSLTKKSLPLPR